MTELANFFLDVSASVDRELEKQLASNSYSPPILIEAMRWSIFAGGKRFRPALVFAAGRTFGANEDSLTTTAAAIEMLHTYSLIHDDLPAMDDDDLRRGRETCHRRFGEATAILAGDALQAKAFETVARADSLSDETKVDLLSGLGEAAARMVSGQQLDLESEGKNLSIENVDRIHINKTGALVAFSVAAGATIGNASKEELASISAFGTEIGLLFQITDDLLDITGSTAILGKTAGKDRASDKATYPNAIGVEASRTLAAEIANRARTSLMEVKRESKMLDSMVTFLLQRET
ncbi:MAG: polyprenyl synthetase family protein [Pyrinomonadaceae bacterium]